MLALRGSKGWRPTPATSSWRPIPDQIRPRSFPRSVRKLYAHQKLQICHFYSSTREHDSTEQSLPRYKYERLNWASNEIRLIEILPQDSQDGLTGEGTVRCSIIQASLRDKPEFIALSYAWGDNTKNRSMVLNGKRMEITTSLDVLLRHLRSSQAHNFGSRRIWVDAISINQEDELEKAWQVQQMSRIFKKAEYTLVWLGTSADSSEMAIRTVRSLGASASAAYEPMENRTMDLVRHLSQSPDGFGLALNALLQRTWWKRIWVVQEFAVSKDVVFMCGNVTIGWEFFFRALDTIGKYRRVVVERQGTLGAREHRKFMSSLSLIAGALRLFQIRSAFQGDWKRFSMWELLALKRFGMQASDHRDMVYALTGIAENAAVQHLYPDYTKHAREVFTDVAKSFLIEGKLRTLWLCTQPRTLHNFPSWVPDWSSRWQGETRWFSSDGGYGTSQAIFVASGNTKPDVSFSVNSGRQVLHLEGHFFDTVHKIESAFDIASVTTSDGFHRVHIALGQRIRAMWVLQRQMLTRGANYTDAMVRTVVTDMDPVWSPDMRFTYRRATSSSLRQLYMKYRGDVFPAMKSSNDVQGLHEVSAAALDVLFRHHGRRPFITGKGHLGLGPAAMQAGDTIIIVRGAELPLIFRQGWNGNSTIIGEAYVDGIMDGEALAKHPITEVFDIV